MSVLLIACCYWKKANSWGATSAIVVGAVIPMSFLLLQQISATRPMMDNIGPYACGIAAYILTASAMVIGSYLKPSRMNNREVRI
jgi:SSS family solute:Na+ symporter